MALSPQRIRDTQFKSARRGYDQGEVDAFVDEVASALEAAQNDATAMEARARAAVARLQELSQQGTAPAEADADVHPNVEESETISRTLLLAQRTADLTIAEAQAEADRVLAAARDEASSTLDTAREQAASIVDDARAEARRAGESERVQVEGEVQALLARRDFLESDVDHLEQYLVAQRERIVEAVGALNDLVQRVPGGLADMRRPLLSAAAEPQPDEGGAASDEPAHATGDVGDEAADEPSTDGPLDAGTAERGGDSERTEERALDAADDAGRDPDDELTEITRVAAGPDATPASAASPLFDEHGRPANPP